MSLAEKVPQALQAKIEKIIDNVKPSPWLNETQKIDYIAKIKALLVEKSAVLIAHYYVDDDIQALAEATGG
jgi:quinolinate synthase